MESQERHPPQAADSYGFAVCVCTRSSVWVPGWLTQVSTHVNMMSLVETPLPPGSGIGRSGAASGFVSQQVPGGRRCSWSVGHAWRSVGHPWKTPGAVERLQVQTSRETARHLWGQSRCRCEEEVTDLWTRNFSHDSTDLWLKTFLLYLNFSGWEYIAGEMALFIIIFFTNPYDTRHQGDWWHHLGLSHVPPAPSSTLRSEQMTLLHISEAVSDVPTWTWFSL